MSSGLEATDEVFRSPASIVFDQAETGCTPSRPSWWPPWPDTPRRRPSRPYAKRHSSVAVSFGSFTSAMFVRRRMHPWSKIFTVLIIVAHGCGERRRIGARPASATVVVQVVLGNLVVFGVVWLANVGSGVPVRRSVMPRRG
jgi:hypothetical protein